MMWSVLSCADCEAPVKVPAVIAARVSGSPVHCPVHDPAVRELAPSAARNWVNTVVPPDFRRVTLDQVDSAPTRALLKAVTDAFPGRYTTPAGVPVRVIPMGGMVGTGKSSAAWATAIELVRSGKVDPRHVVCGSEAELLEPNAHVTAYGRPGQPSTWRTVIPTGTKVLLLDDLGHGRYGDPGARMALVKGLLDRASERDVLTLITTNLTACDLEAAIGAPAWSRLVAMSGLSLRTLPSAGTIDRRTGVNRSA